MQSKLDISLSDLDLPFTASCIMDYHDPEIVQVGNRVIVGYLADDNDCENPLESCDGMGVIYSSHRHSNTHAEMRQALALDSDWQKNLDLVDEHMDEFRPAWIEAATQSDEFQEWVKGNATKPVLFGETYFRKCAEDLWQSTDGEYRSGRDNIYNFQFTDVVREKVWESLREAGKIGDRDAIVLDCFQHGNEVWSVTGSGPQCQFDTARSAGVWVPEDCAREEIDRRAKVYAFGQVIENPNRVNGNREQHFVAKLDGPYRGEASPEFRMWHEAFAWLEEKVKGLELAPRDSLREVQMQVARQRAASEMVKDILTTYNSWLAGECYGIVAAQYDNVGTNDEPEWEFVESDECWGFIGDDYAMAEARANARAFAHQMTVQAA